MILFRDLAAETSSVWCFINLWYIFSDSLFKMLLLLLSYVFVYFFLNSSINCTVTPKVYSLEILTLYQAGSKMLECRFLNLKKCINK